ncbi:splicing factor 3B subunit 1-like [Dorcoceras hygrometricum]|uniref:Splicing factor 3B subunit 1-like n=1 Tax=Dorcoceras hygrometricum TaxID=472368 RepID=A0A2Z7AKG6_9LAMI|nr:splicing factor 3B subunit 1-like [Dorcoceras hygrometricum]
MAIGRDVRQGAHVAAGKSAQQLRMLCDHACNARRCIGLLRATSAHDSIHHAPIIAPCLALDRLAFASLARPACNSRALMHARRRAPPHVATADGHTEILNYSVATDLTLVAVAQEAVPIQMILTVTPTAPKRKAPKRRLQLPAGSDDEIVEKASNVMKTDMGESDMVMERTDKDTETVPAGIEHSTAVNDEDDNLDGAENEISRKMAYFTAPKQYLEETLRSGEDDDISGVEKPRPDDIRKDVKDQKVALSTEFEDRVAAVSNDLLDFRAQAQENYNNLSSQLGELVAYINRGGNDKKAISPLLETEAQGVEVAEAKVIGADPQLVDLTGEMPDIG